MVLCVHSGAPFVAGVDLFIYFDFFVCLFCFVSGHALRTVKSVSMHNDLVNEYNTVNLWLTHTSCQLTAFKEVTSFIHSFIHLSSTALSYKGLCTCGSVGVGLVQLTVGEGTVHPR